MKNKNLFFSIWALLAMTACTSQNFTSVEESYRDDVFMRLLADSSGIVEERLLSADGENGFVYYYEFYNLLPVNMELKGEDLKNMCDYYNFNQIANSSFGGYDTYARARYALGEDSLQLLNAWKANMKWLRGRQVFYDSTVQHRLSEALEARIDVLNNGKSDVKEDSDNRLVMDDIIDSMTQWNPIKKVSEESRDTMWNYLEKVLSPQNYFPEDFPDVYGTFLNGDDPATAQELATLFECYHSAKDIDLKAACLFTLIGAGFLSRIGNDTLMTFIKDAERIFESATYTPMLPLLWRAYRCLYNRIYSCPSKDCYCYNQRYNYYRKLIAYTYLRHIEAYPEYTAKIQYLFLCSENDILKEGEYPYGNQSAAEVIYLFWKGVVL